MDGHDGGRGAPGFMAAAVRTEITPTDLTALNPIGGGAFEGVHDPLWMRVLLLETDGTQIALVTTDLIEVGDMRAVRERLAAQTGIAADHVLITASHTHSAPRLGRVTPGALAHDGGPESDAYSASVYDAMAAAIRRAQDSLRPADVDHAVGRVDVNVNRDLFVDGRWRLGHNGDGPSDKALRLVTVRDERGRVIATVLNYAVHSVTTLGSGMVSGDIAGAAARWVEEALGDDAVALWTVGALGDQNPRVQLGFPGDFSPQQIDRAFAAADAQGLLIGAEAVRLIEQGPGSPAAPRLRARQVALDLPTRAGTDVMASMRQAQVDSVELLLSVVDVGGIVLAGVSGEVTTSVAARLRAASPRAATVLLSMVNDRIGYLPDDAAYSLPTFEANGSPVAQGVAADAIVGTLVRMIRELDR